MRRRRKFRRRGRGFAVRQFGEPSGILRLDAINEMLAYAEAKRTQNIYDDAGEEELSQITDEGLLALYGAADEAEAKAILERVKAAIDAVEPAGSRGE